MQPGKTSEGMRSNFSAGLVLAGLAWLAVFYLLPGEIIASQATHVFSAAVAIVVPSIQAYAAVSPDPARVALFMAFQWCLVPPYTYWGYVAWGRRALSKGRIKGLPVSRFGAWLTVVVFVGLALAAMFVPESISVRNYAIRPSWQWDNWMHESLLPHALLAVALPVAVSTMLLAAWLYAVLPSCPISADRSNSR